ncbi:mRNA export factor GLE1 [Patella vulgata]|uniref:mRNA export factor GLE1 n=1 Tax=Patella vulgata TaxID=6465 RepID=UPI00217FD21C|nr:mRNA export factor GLE1 [Patella vulgata]
MNILLQLQNTSKGKLPYNNKKETLEQRKKWLTDISPPPSINKFHKGNSLISTSHGASFKVQENVSKNNNYEEELLYVACYSGLSPPKVPVSNESGKARKPEISTPPPKPKPEIVDKFTPVSPEYNSSSKLIKEYEQAYEKKKEAAIAKKRQEFDQNMAKLTQLSKEQLMIREKQQNDQLKSLHQQTEKHLKEKDESEKQVQVMKESHRQHQQMLDAKVLEVEKRKQQLKDEARKRQEQIQAMAQKIHASINILISQFITEFEGCPHKEYFSEDAKATYTQIRSIKTKVDTLLESFKAAMSKQEDLKKLMELFEMCKRGLESVKTHIADANKKGKEVEEQKALAAKAAQLAQEQQQALPPAQTDAISTPTKSSNTSTNIKTSEDVMVDALEEYSKLQGNLSSLFCKLEQIQAMAQKIHASINILISQFITEFEGCPHKEYFSEDAKATYTQIRSIKTKVDTLLESFKAAISKQEDLKKLMELFEICKRGLESVKTHIADANKKGKEVEEQKALAAKAAQLAQEQQQALPPAQTDAISTPTKSSNTSTNIKTSEDVMVDALEEYSKLQGKLQKITESLNAFVNNPQMKKYKFELQKAVNTPINAISPESSSHLQDKLHRLTSLMSGQVVELSGKRISAKEAPEGILFCKNLAAKMIVKKGAEQVSSKHETAFAIAAVTVGLWCHDADIGDLLLAHFHKACPYTIPFILPKQEKQSLEKYHEYLGYKVEDGVIEDQDKFLKRMSGVMRLYAAILVTSPPRGSNSVHPFGIEHAWIWLSRVLNSPPQPDITATMIYDMLYVTGHLLHDQFRNQFLKLLSCLFNEYVPKLRSVAVGGGPVSRLETFIGNVIKSGGKIAKPEGLLPSNFL